MKHLIELFSLHQCALMQAAAADHDALRLQHQAKADRLATEIASIQRAYGANAVELLPAASIQPDGPRP